MGTERDLLAELVRAGEEIQRVRHELERTERRLEYAEEWLERELTEEEWTDYLEAAEGLDD